MRNERGSQPKSPVIEQALKWLRWLLVLPVSLAIAFLLAGIISFLHAQVTSSSTGSLGYVAAFVSGLVYVWAALYTAHTVAPSRKGVVAVVLGILLLGDLTFIHLIMETDMLQQAMGSRPDESGLGVLRSLLRADDFSQLRHGGVAKVAGALMGLLIAWRTLSEKKSRVEHDA